MNKDPNNEKLAELLRSLPKEKLDEGFDKRFWEKFDHHTPALPTSGIKPPVFAWASAGVLVGLTVLALTQAVDRPLVTVIQGGVSIVHKDSDTSSPEKNKLLKVGDSIKTDKSGWVVLEVDNGYRVKIQPDSQIKIKNLKSKWLGGKTTFYLTKGQALVSIGDQVRRKYPVEIFTPNAFARALGTQFMVSAPTLDSPASKISVLKGVVRVGAIKNDWLARSGIIDVPQGFETTVKYGQNPLKPESIVENAKKELEEFFQFSKRNRAILLISMSPARVQELLKPCGIYIRFETRTETALEVEAIAKEIMDAQATKDEVAHLLAVRQLEGTVLDQDEIDPVPLLLFVGSYYSYLKEYSHAIRVFDFVAKKFPTSSFASVALAAESHIYRAYMQNSESAAQKDAEVLVRYPGSIEASSISSHSE